MSIKVKIIEAEGTQRAFESAGNIAANTKFGIEKAFYFIGKDLTGEFNRQVLAKNKTGQLYIIHRGKTRRRHIASAPGETPANISGKYRKAIGFKVDGANQLIFGNSAEHANFLESGTRFMKKRPGLGNAVKASERTIIRDLSSNIEDRL
ncbi:MAG: hypothetical protein KAT69_01690 [Candidatus Aminicenantes bacterium]|nr:hypothetical protein [Candidatus Aminicenantes bacterium]